MNSVLSLQFFHVWHMMASFENAPNERIFYFFMIETPAVRQLNVLFVLGILLYVALKTQGEEVHTSFEAL